MLVSSLVLVLVAYAVGVLRLWQATGFGRGISRSEAVCFLSGWTVIIFALSETMDEWSKYWIAAHMVQHGLLMVVAAPLMAASRPLIAWLWLLPISPRRRVLRSILTRPVAVTWAVMTAPLTVFLLHAVALWVWHLPALYDLTLAHERVHIAQHASFFGTASLFWWGIAHGRYGRVFHGPAVMYVWATAMHSGVLGAMMAHSRHVWYVSYLIPHGQRQTSLENQQLAGMLMCVPAGLDSGGGRAHLLCRLAPRLGAPHEIQGGDTGTGVTTAVTGLLLF